MRRVSVVGVSGSGKSVLGRALADALDAPYLELDAIYWGADWTPASDEQFAAAVEERTSAGSWVIDGNYTRVRQLIWSRADTVVWFDLARYVVMVQVGQRTLRRLVRREELWNGNRQEWREVMRRDPDRNIVVWAWQNHPRYRALFAAAATDPANAHLRFVRIRSRDDARRLLTAVRSAR